jgi:cytochrome b pre-mRNA-processing protein 3
MLRFLFPRLTTDRPRGAELFNWVTKRARAPHWYVDGEVPDTVDGRFAMLATIAALVMSRLERDEDAETSVSLTERFVEAMEAEHREMGLGDPKLGRTVRKLVGSLGRRVELWRDVTSESPAEVTLQSVYGEAPPSPAALQHSANALERLRQMLDSTPIERIAQGRIE